MSIRQTKGYKIVQQWFKSKGWKLMDFQQQTIEEFSNGKHGLLNAPTGSGKTYGLFLPILVDYINKHPDSYLQKQTGTKVIWITPLRALTKDIQRNLHIACDEMNIPWTIGVRTGDISTKERNAQKKQMPDVLLITPESMHTLFAQKDHTKLFDKVFTVVCDEWHELLSTKRGTQTELTLARLRNINPLMRIWGISATIGNIDQAMQILVGIGSNSDKTVIVRSNTKKKIKIESILPDKIERLPWAGYLGTSLIKKVMAIVAESKTTLLFTNTRSQTEIWYRLILEKYPDMAGLIALHHGSLDREVRDWVENALHLGTLKLVICTSSLDLGVDFRPVETVLQVGSPKSIARFVQRAGRSGHQPGSQSRIYFVPTHALELIEAVSLRKGVNENIQEDRIPVMNAYDVLAQYMVTRAVGDGFEEEALFNEVKSTYAFQFLQRDEWEWLLGFITTGGPSLVAYDEFKKVEREGNLYKVNDRKIAMRHRLSMGTIVSDSSMKVQYVNGKYLGTIEEQFVSRLKPGDVFSFAGMNLEYVRIHEMAIQVRKTTQPKGSVPRWAGGRMPLSSQLSAFIRERLDDALDPETKEPEIKKMQPLLLLQDERSAIPKHNEFLVEQCKTREGFHIFMYPFEGRLVHEGIAALLAYRISKIQPITFSMAMNDYGFELLSDEEITLEYLLEEHELFSDENLLDDIQHSINSVEMARRKFREIAAISGLVFQGYPGKGIKTKHLQASASLFFDVIRDHEPGNLLIRQAYQETLDQQLEEQRMRKALKRISTQKFIFRYTQNPSPFAFPIMVDRLREQLSSEKLEDRVSKMLQQMEKDRGDQT
jgi:ATP-dependent Lhr-like helicase